MMASNAPFNVVKEPEDVPDVAVRVTCVGGKAYPARVPLNKSSEKSSFVKPDLKNSIISLKFNAFAPV